MALTSACTHPTFTVPTGSPLPAPDGLAAFAAATSVCRAITSYTAELHVSGRIGSARPFKATILAGLTASDQIRLEMPAPFGRAVFILAGTGREATLLLRDDHALVASADRIVEALVGLPLGPKGLLALLSGCGGQAAQATDAVRYGDVIAVRTPEARLFLRRPLADWRVAAAEVGSLLVDYQSSDGAWPKQMRVTSNPGADRATSTVTIAIDARQVEVDTPINPAAFAVTVPPNATPLTLDALRAAGPMGDRQP